LPKPLHILVDLTSALSANAGIPQSARQMAWLLSRSPHWQTSGLVLSLHERSRASLFGIPRNRAQARGDDSEYLSALLDAAQKRKMPFWYEVVLDLRRMMGRSYPLIRFADNIWAEIFWEHYFAPGFPSELRHEVKKIPFYRSPLTRPEATLIARHNFPTAHLDTRGIDLVIFQNPTPVRVSRGTIKVIRCHDLVPLLRFDTQPQAVHLIRDFRIALGQCVHDGSHFACVSEATMDALVELHPEVRDRASVVPNSIAVADWIESPLAVPVPAEPYFLAVGTVEPRKNYRRLLRAFRIHRASQPPIGRLVLVGGKGWRNKNEILAIEEAVAEGWLTWHEQVEPHILAGLYQNAHALVGASVDEGFGMPPLEAAALGTPSVLSDLRVFRSHLGDTAEYFDPYDTDSIASGLARMTAARRAELAPAARVRAQGFGPNNEAAVWQDLLIRLTGRSDIPKAAPVSVAD
jgi:glycosyltransferase involved in cell wall biosynthesis